MKNEITEVLKYDDGKNEFWIYSESETSNHLPIYYKYYMLFLKNNVPSIQDIKNPIETLQNINIESKNIYEGSIDYIKFLAIKEIAEKNVVEKIRK